ncbi:E3 ubiquitin-protein ligase RNF213-like [Dendronephthya gigantea]|uniref:E3 ubiquitin-protein ligase RNF213-like n=1 Tax=Dendronephthya gigantea TaxID=151771 RepID=UPI00106D4C47|nr:E3 ubiquitin-protein ligase RNF213-like [Dendronephthya gigantea]
MVDMLLSHIEKIESKEQSAYQDLLDLVMKKAPSLNEALKLFEVSKVSCFFADDVEKLNFFVKFYEKQTASTENENVAAKLSKFYKIPEKIRHKMHDYLFQTLLEYAKSDEEFNDDDEEKFLQAIISERDLALDQVFDVLMELSKSKCIRRLMMVPKILGNTCFTKSWRGMTYEKKLKLCESWVITNCVNGGVGRSVDGVDKVIAVYGAIDDIIRSSPMNIANSTLVTDLSTEVERRFLKNEDASSLLKALAEIKRYLYIVQESYKSHVENILKKKPKKVLKESCTILMEHCSNRLAQELLSFILDIIDVQEIGKVGQIKENNFKNILGSCDIWIIFLKIPEIDNRKYRIGEKICRELDKRIKDGDISLGLLKDVDKKKEDVSMLCAILRNASGPPKCNQADIQKLILDHISRLMNVAEDSSKKIDMLTSAIECSSKIIEDVCAVPGIESVTESLNDLRKILRTGSVKDLEDETSWGDLLLFLSAAEDLHTVGNSLSFRTVAKRCLRELSGASEDEQENAATPVHDFHSLIAFLTTTAIEQFQEQWDRVFKDPKSLNAETMKTLLGIMKGEDLLVKELEMLETYFGERFSPEIQLYIHDYIKYPHLLEQVQHFIAIRDIFGLEDIPNDTMTVLLQFQTVMENRNEPTPTSLHQSMENIKQIVSVFSGEELTGVIKELSTCRELLSFMEEIVDEDIRFLIDAVEEHSDQFVFESSVSDLIDVHGFLAPLIRKKNDKTLELQGFLKMLKESCNGHKDIEGKIKQCSMNVNSLRGLYMSIANRGEMTKEIISNCLSRGKYSVSQEDGKCETKMSYVLPGDGEDKFCSYSLSDLHDLRSRAHLIISSRIKVTSSRYNESSEDIDFDDFINQVNLLSEISNHLLKLRSSGYVKYRRYWKRIKTTDELKSVRDSLLNDQENWESVLKNVQEKFYRLNYYRSDQLCKLYDFLIGEPAVDCDEVLSLIHFVDRTITKQQLEDHKEKFAVFNPNDSPEILLSSVGEALKCIFNEVQDVIRRIPDEGETDSYRKKSHQERFSSEAEVTPGKIFVASLEPDSSIMINVLLTLYENTSNAYPEPYQIIFCNSQTNWEDLHLLLQRCFMHSKFVHRKSLYCIANVELLPNELQFKLVKAIKEKQKYYESSEAIKEYIDYQLALICCGGDHHHIVEQFSQYTHRIAGMSDHSLGNHLQSGWPDVKIITSKLPGLGKTEQVKQQSLEKSMGVVTFPISGPFEPSKVIQRLKEIKIKKYHCLHLDIGEVSDPLLLDTFLFQLIVTGMVSAGNQFYHLPTTHIYIEIANTLKDTLRESLIVLKYFKHIHLEWQNYKDFLVSSKITSNVQVVCQYLDLFDRQGLDSNEISFCGENTFKPLPPVRCKQLLARYFSSAADVTFTILHTFLGVLADQLLKYSKSTFFKIENLESMVGEESTGVRSNLFSALLEVSKEFASRSITTSPSGDKKNLSQEESARALDRAVASTGTSADDMVERVTGMIQWENSNHLLIVFHGLNSQAITAVYRKRSSVPLNVIELLKSQVVRGSTELDDMEFLTEDELQEKLEKIACMKLVGKKDLFTSYALTPDNILKMILIILRVRANVPVIIMGETGCGKTSLIRYLADTCGIKLETFNLHAGRSEEDTIIFIKKKEYDAKNTKEKIWIFLDEINTCDHLGLISDVICHHSLLGRPLAKNLVFLAACNPYKLRPEEHIKTAGLEGKNITDEYSKLVYRVHPLPEAMIDYVWDYGSLAPEDERNYIQRMVRNLPSQYEDMLIELLASSQEFIRNAEKNHFCVSLRDVYRCIHLIGWFEDMRRKRQKLKETKKEYSRHLRKYHSMSQQYKKNPMIKSIVLALAHCYLSRLPTGELRKDYRRCMMDVFSRHDFEMKATDYSDNFAAIVRIEEEDYLDRMELPNGTARNAALRENVFVMLVCILNRIPIFVVGKPGCSKSLSIQLIRSNLRGRDSQNVLFRKLPQLYVVSYQGSESSTSEGIIKVFEKARKYKTHNKDGNVLPVVLLDEVGLAENSKYNPLKVLHSLLEPGKGEFPDVAVVGISNWSLDAAKMNRAIHLSRPEPTREDLYDTGYSLHYADSTDGSQRLGEKVLKSLADGYFEYEEQQHDNFHGLRDYYSLIKSLTGCSTSQDVNMSLQRNFGGLYDEVANIQKIFLDKLSKTLISSDEDIIPVTQLIQANLADAHARHLMLITRGDSAHGILKQILSSLDKESITIFGSRFEEDLSEDYNYRILSRIILCMERDCVLILKDLENIYGSLYDLLNQNYAVVGKRKNCRVALGAYSNPMCQVHDGFRCIVLMDEQNVKDSDPPFLNRFEKQVLRFSDVLTEEQQKVITELHRWVQAMSTVEGLESHFCETDLFIGFHEDTLPSLVLSHRNETDMEEVSKKCKDDLMWVASPDGVLRAKKCNVLKENDQDIHELNDEYFKKPLHEGLAAFLDHVVNNFQKSPFFGSDEVGSKTVVMTFSNIYTDIGQCLSNNPKCQVERLSAYKSEKQLAERINAFWNSSEKELLVLQCKPDMDAPHLLLARSIIEEKRDSYKQCSSEMDSYAHKHVCIVLHVQRVENEDVPWQFSFLCGWRQVFLDVLERPIVPLNEILGESVQKLLTSSIWPIRNFTQNDLLWCFTCIKYTQSQRPLDSVLHIAKNLFSSSQIAQAIERLILQSINLNSLHKDQGSHLKESWQVQVACDRQSLVNSSTLYGAMEQYVSRLVRNPLAKIIYFLEKENAWPPHLVHDYSETQMQELESIWCNFINQNAIFEVSQISEPLGTECYILDTTSLDLYLPFSQVVVRKADGAKELFFEDHATLLENCDNLDENGQLKLTVRKQRIERFSKTIINLVPEFCLITSDFQHLYLKDVLAIVTADFSETLSRSQRVSIAQATFISEVERYLPVKDMPQFCALLHTFVWDYQEQMLDSLRMVDFCRPFIDLNVQSSLIDVFCKSEEVMMIEATETPHSEVEINRRSDSGSKNDSSNDLSEAVKITGNEAESANWPFIGQDFLSNLTDEMLYGSEGATTVNIDETFDSEESSIQDNTNRNDACNEAHESKITHWPLMEPNNAIDDMFRSSKEVVHATSAYTEKTSYKEFNEVVFATSETERSDGGELNFQTELQAHETEPSQMSDDDEKYLSQDFQDEKKHFKEMKNHEYFPEDKQQEVPENLECQVNSERFGDILVTVYCKEMFPSHQIIETNGGLESWIRNANLLLSSAFKISEQSPAFHYLRLCTDFARIIFTSIALPTSLSSLYTLNEIGLRLEPEYLDHEDSFQMITEELIRPLEEEMENHKDKQEALQKFSALFYGRCIDTNVDTCAVRPIIEHVLSLERPKLVMMMSPVILRLLKVEEMESPGIFINLIADPSAIVNCPCLQIIDDVFKDLYTNDLMHHDSYAAVMICDLIQSLMNFEDNFRIEDIDSSDSEELKIAKLAMGLISNTCETSGLVILSAVAFLRGFFTMLAHFVAERPSILKEHSLYAHMMKEVNSILRGSKTSLQMFFLKQLHRKASLFDIEKWISESSTLPTLQEQWQNERSQYKIVFTTVLKYPEYKEAKAAYWKLMSNDESCMKEFIERCQSSPNHAFAFVGILVNMIYLQRTVRKLTDKDEVLVNWFASNVVSFSKLLQELSLRVLGRRDFYCPELQLSPESSVEDVEMALLVLHIATVVATNQEAENSLFYNYFINPAEFKKMHEDEMRSVFEYPPYVKESTGLHARVV